MLEETVSRQLKRVPAHGELAPNELREQPNEYAELKKN